MQVFWQLLLHIIETHSFFVANSFLERCSEDKNNKGDIKYVSPQQTVCVVFFSDYSAAFSLQQALAESPWQHAFVESAQQALVES